MAGDGIARDPGGDTDAAAKRLDATGRPLGSSLGASRPSPERTAVDAAHLPGRHMVEVKTRDAEVARRAWDAAASVVDPEIPVLTIADLGVLREVDVADG